MTSRKPAYTPAVASRLDHAFLLLYSRPATPAEQTECQSFVTQHGLPALCRVLLNTHEFLYLD